MRSEPKDHYLDASLSRDVWWEDHLILEEIFRGSAVKIMFEVIDNPTFVRAFGLTSCL